MSQIPSEWLLRFRALREGSDFQETCANSLNSANSSSGSCNVTSIATEGRPIEAIKAIGTQHPKILSDQERSNAEVDWRDLFEERAAIREFEGGYPRAEAERLAWGNLENRWHLQYGERVPRDLCAGCRKPIGNADALDLIDGNRVHLAGDRGCLIRHGHRWRAVASRALAELGLRPLATGEGEAQ
jgi:hypothetical protein